MAEVEREVLASLHVMLHKSESAAAQYVAGDSVFDYHYKNAKKQYNSLAALMLPYEDIMAGVSDAQLFDLWKQAYGDPDDPEIAAEIKKTQDYLRNKMKEVSDG